MKRIAVVVTVVLIGALSPALSWFSPAAAAGSGLRYLALGDSYASGPGAGGSFGGGLSLPDYKPIDCTRSSNSWEALLAKDLGYSAKDTTWNATCSGAPSDAVLGIASEVPSPEQFGLVTVQVGGDNNEFFSNLVTYCVSRLIGQNCSDNRGFTDAVESVLGQTENQLADAFTKLRHHFSSAAVVAVGYPHIEPDHGNIINATCVNPTITELAASATAVPPNEGLAWGPYAALDFLLGGGAVSLANGLSFSDSTYLGAVTTSLNSHIERAAARGGVGYVDVGAALSGHHLCDKHPWAHNFNNEAFEAALHPTKEGHAAIHDRFTQAYDVGPNGIVPMHAATPNSVLFGSEIHPQVAAVRPARHVTTPFAGSEGARINLTAYGFSEATSLQVAGPKGTLLSLCPCGASYEQPNSTGWITIPSSGQYTLTVDATRSTAAATAGYFRIFMAPAPLTGRLAFDGSALSIGPNAPYQVMQVSFKAPAKSDDGWGIIVDNLTSDGNITARLDSQGSPSVSLRVPPTGAEDSWLLPTLKPGANYTLMLTGEGAATASLNMRLVRGLPGAPTITSAVGNANDSSATVAWNPPTTGGSPVLVYVVTVEPGDLTVQVSGGAAHEAKVSGMAPDVAYTVSMHAENAAGRGPQTTVVAVGGTPFGPPIPPLTLGTAHLPTGIASIPYSFTLSATQGSPPYHWFVSSGSLPAGVSLQSDSGLLTGTPTTVGASPVGLSVRDTAGKVATAPFVLHVAPLANWESSRGPLPATYANSKEGYLSPSNIVGLQPRWSASFPFYGYNAPEVAYKGLVYAFRNVGGAQGGVAAFDSVSGQVMWSAHIDQTFQMIESNGVLVISGGRNIDPTVGPDKGIVDALYAFDGLTGAPLWSRENVYLSVGRITADDGRVYVIDTPQPGTPASAEAFDLMTGAPVWSNAVVGAAFTASAFYNYRTYFASSAGFYVSLPDGSLSLLAPSDGHVLWNRTGVFARSVVGDAVIGVKGTSPISTSQTWTADITSWSLTSGALQWKVTIGGSVQMGLGPPFISAADDGRNVVVFGGETTEALDATTGALKWSANKRTSAAALANGVLYANDSNGRSLYAMRVDTGATLLTIGFPVLVFTQETPVVASGSLFLGVSETVAAYGVDG